MLVKSTYGLTMCLMNSFIPYLIYMLDKNEIADKAQEWFNCDRKHAELFAEDLIKDNKVKDILVEWLPHIVMFSVLIIYLICHR